MAPHVPPVAPRGPPWPPSVPRGPPLRLVSEPDIVVVKGKHVLDGGHEGVLWELLHVSLGGAARGSFAARRAARGEALGLGLCGGAPPRAL